MMRPAHLLSSLLLLLSVCLPSAAQPRTVTLDECRRLALDNNKDLRRSALAIEAAAYDKDAAFSAYLPALDFAGGYLYNQKGVSVFATDQLLPIKQFNPATGSYEFKLLKNPATGEPVMVNGSPVPEQMAYLPKEALSYDLHNVFFGAVTLTQPIFMGGKINSLNRIAGYALQAAEQLHRAGGQDVIVAVDAAYWQVVSLRAKLSLAESYVNLLDTLHHNVRLMLDQGVATRADLLSVDVKLNAAQVDLAKVRNGLSLSRMALAQVCGLPVDSELDPADTDAPPTLSTTPALLPPMSEVYAERPDLQALEISVSVAREKARAVRASMMPNLALVGSYTFSNPNMFEGFSKKFSGMFSVGAMLKVPLWHWGGNYNRYRAERARATAAALQLDNARSLVDLQVRQAAYKTDEAVKTLDMASANIASADENLRCANVGFADGVMTVDLVMAAQTAWLKAHSEQIDATIDLRLCRLYLDKALGTLNP